MQIVISLDSGGSKTICLLSDTQGNIISIGKSGSANINYVSVEHAKDNIKLAIEIAFEKADLKTQDICWIFATVLLDSEYIFQVTNKYIDCCRVIFIGEPEATLFSVLGSNAGVVALSGTGSFTCSRNEKGEIFVLGGEGIILGDEGSGYDIGRKALVACTHELDKRGSPTKLTGMLCKKWGIDTYEIDNLSALSDIYARVRLNPDFRREIASLTSIVKEAADKNDEISVGILKTAGEDMARQVVALMKTFPVGTYPISIGWQGGAWNSGEFMINSFKEKILEHVRSATFVEPIFTPVFGTYFAGLEKIGVGLSSELINRVKRNSIIK